VEGDPTPQYKKKYYMNMAFWSIISELRLHAD